jgi:hypothetical protein
MLTFDRKQMMEWIRPLPKRLRVVFAGASAQRQLPNYLSRSAANPAGNLEAAMRILRELWDSVARNEFELEKLRRDVAVCDALIRYYEKYPEGIELAEDAVASLAYALETAISGGSQETMWAAERAYSALDQYIVERFGVDVNAPHAQARIDAFPIMQAELSRQRADLLDLNAAAKRPGNEAAVIAQIKRRAERDAVSFLG